MALYYIVETALNLASGQNTPYPAEQKVVDKLQELYLLLKDYLEDAVY